ncbi:hypothetical protein [Anabaena catenula]|uniref:Uncharacterized protein n=1 Tax=Anabaena catenula FACHB-362 TaxID=2692877 RepID=A0ABR8J1V5_9NOST|nr:hypothetical protein [Anabaena catenula]MBD2692319.1 hypothetical protein [Anabaena catenula FACHB-362]
MKNYQIKLPNAPTVILIIVSFLALDLLFLWIFQPSPKQIAEEVIGIPLDKSVKLISKEYEYYGLVGDGYREIILEIPVEESQKFLDKILQSSQWQIVKSEQTKVDTCSPFHALPSFPGPFDYYLLVKCYDGDGLEVKGPQSIQKFDIVIYYPQRRMLIIKENWI